MYRSSNLTLRQLFEFITHAYQIPKYYSSDDIIPEGWVKILEKKGHLSGYNGMAFLNEECKEVLVINSGTSLPLELSNAKLSNFAADLKSVMQIYQGEVPSQFFYSADPFFERVLHCLGDDVDQYKITVTGHSLGAVLSEMITAKYTDLGYDIECIVFDSLGSLPFIDESINLNLTIFNAEQNWLNTMQPQAGKVVQFIPDDILVEGDHVIKDNINFFSILPPTHLVPVMMQFFDRKSGSLKHLKEMPDWNDMQGGYRSIAFDLIAEKTKILQTYIDLYIPKMDGEPVCFEDDFVFVHDYYCTSWCEADW